jgi:uncharacterized protein (TIGR02611 family)
MSRESLFQGWKRLPHPLRWIGAAVVGGTLIAVGVVLLVLPGPGLLLIAMGVAVLATEFAWAETILRRMKRAGTVAVDKAKQAVSRKPAS